MSQFLPDQMPQTEQRQETKGPESYLSLEERKALQRSLSFPEDLPPKFKSWLIDFIAVNIPQIPISQIVGFDHLVYNRGTTFPASPKDGQMFGYQVDADTIWQFRYDSGITDAYKWVFSGGAPVRASVTTAQSTASTSYVNLATVGPTVTVPLAGDYTISVSSKMSAASSTAGMMSFEVGATAASDDDALALEMVTAITGFAAASRFSVKTAIAAASALTAKYRISDASVTFAQRVIWAEPIRVSG